MIMSPRTQMLALLLSAALVSVVSAAAVPAPLSFIKPLTAWTGYDTMFRSGDFTAASTLPVGTLTDKWGMPLASRSTSCTSVSCSEVDSGNPWNYDISANPDFFSLHSVGGKMFGLTQFEADSPAAFFVTKFQQSSKGLLQPQWHKPVNFSADGGLWIPCAGSLTPWNSHAGGEEYEPDGFCWAYGNSSSEAFKACMGDTFTTVTSMMRYFGFYNASNTTYADVLTSFNPYLYGHAFEVSILNAEGKTKAQKHYVMGRHSYELWVVMPDNKTVYSTDDGTSTSFWKFVADKAGDMSSGTLYGAKFKQITDNYGGDFNVSWVELASATEAELKAMVTNLKFNDIFDWVMPVNGSCPSDFVSISKRDNGLGQTCLKLKAGMEKAAAFFESRRYLNYLGGTTEFSKFEGLVFEPTTNKLYGAMSQVRNSMEDNKSKGKSTTVYDFGGSNDIRLPYNPCGCIYAFNLDKNFSVTRGYGELCGVPVTAGLPGRNEGKCDTASISEPDNVVVMAKMGQLIIGEDTNENRIDVVWQYDLATKELTRIQTSPPGSETTSPYWYPNLNGWSYLTTCIQHPYGESDTNMATMPGNSGLAGYCGAWGFKSSDFAKGEVLKFLPVPYPRNDAERHNFLASYAGYRLANNTAVYKQPAHTMTGQNLPGPKPN